MHSFEEGDDGCVEVDAVLAGHFKRVTKRFAGDAELVGIVAARADEIIGLFDKRIELEVDGLVEEIADEIGGAFDFVAEAPPGAEAGEHSRGGRVVGGALDRLFALACKTGAEPLDGGAMVGGFDFA